jgi:two-component system sensor histidine kinase/response regulator
MQNANRETILVVDDNSINLRVLANCLSKVGYRVLAAEDGETAIQTARQAKPELILLDVMMPGLDGFETCERLKADTDTQKIPVLFLTARSEMGDKLRGFEVGGADYITKPYREAEILARVNTHLTLFRQRRELEGMLVERERFMRIAAHDLRNPLAVILFSTGMGILDAPSPEVRDGFETIEQSANQMKAIIEDFLALQVLHQNKDAGSHFDLGCLTRLVVEQQGLAASVKQTRIECQMPGETLCALGNGDRTHQILTNYLSNAIKYSPPKTLVTVEVSLTASHWRVEVRDQGPGVPEAERTNLFKEFARISNKPTGGETSTGLGLSIVRRLAESMGGRVGADFPPGGGSIFWLELQSVPSPQ